MTENCRREQEVCLDILWFHRPESPFLVYVQSFQEPVQLLLGDLQERIQGVHPPFESAFAQLLVKEPESCTVIMEKFELVVSFVGEDEHCVLERIRVQDRLDVCTQSIYALAKIHRFSDQV